MKNCSSNSGLSRCLKYGAYPKASTKSLPFPCFIKGTIKPYGTHRKKQHGASLHQRKCAGGVHRGGAVCARERTLSPSPMPLLWVLSVRTQKVPPPAGTGSRMRLQTQYKRISLLNLDTPPVTYGDSPLKEGAKMRCRRS